MLISIDHGNKQIKTAHRTFTSGLCASDTPPFGKEVLYYDGKYNTLSNERIPYMRDKTTDDRYFILTLFAIAFELQNYPSYPNEIEDIHLAVGLPPAHYGRQSEPFEQYFLNRGNLNFQLDGKEYTIHISQAVCFPQAYAATAPILRRIITYPKVTIIDIGGFTADYLMVRNGEADLSVCDSLENGVIVLYNRIISKINADYDILLLLLEESDIDSVLLDKLSEYDDAIISCIKEQAQQFIDDLFSKLRERMIDLRSEKTVFVGGGSILLKKQIEFSEKVTPPIFVEEISANTKGYELLFRQGC